MAKFPTLFAIAERFVEIINKAKAGRLDARTMMPILYLVALVFFLGLFLFIFYVEAKSKEGDVPVEDPNEEEEMRKFMEENGMGDLNDLSGLATKPKNDDDAIVYGATEFYDWQQSKFEMEVFIPNLDAGIRGKDVKVDIKPRKLCASVAGKDIINGTLYAEVVPDECNWQIEEDASSGERKVWITLFKKEATLQNKMWPVVVEGDNSKSSASRVKTAPGGMPVTSVDISDESSMKEAIRQAKEAALRRRKAAEGDGPP